MDARYDVTYFWSFVEVIVTSSKGFQVFTYSLCCVVYCYSSGRGAKYCDRCVCLSLCLSVSKFHEIFCTCYLRPCLVPSLTTKQ